MGSERVVNGLGTLDEQDAVFIRATLQGEVLPYPAGSEVLLTDDVVTSVYLVRSGWLGSYVDLADGRRQITRFWLTGDLVGLAFSVASALGLSSRVGEAGYLPSNACSALTPVVLEKISAECIQNLVQSNPEAAMKFLTVYLLNHNELMVWHLTSAGRLNARERIAALILELAYREGLQLSGEPTFTVSLPLSQTVLADALGMTPVHISRTVSQLAAQGILERRRGASSAIVVRDMDRLVELAGGHPFRPGYVPVASGMRPALVESSAKAQNL